MQPHGKKDNSSIGIPIDFTEDLISNTSFQKILLNQIVIGTKTTA